MWRNKPKLLESADMHEAGKEKGFSTMKTWMPQGSYFAMLFDFFFCWPSYWLLSLFFLVRTYADDFTGTPKPATNKECTGKCAST